MAEGATPDPPAESRMPLVEDEVAPHADVVPDPEASEADGPRVDLAIGSFEELYSREYVAMVRLATLMVDSVAVAEELVQDCFVRVHRRWRRIDRPAAYLRTAVMNASRNELRRRDRERRSRRFRPEETVELQADEVLDAVRALPEKRRAAVVLRYYEDLSESEIAETLGVRPGTVKSLLHRGLAQLRASLGDDSRI